MQKSLKAKLARILREAEEAKAEEVEREEEAAAEAELEEALRFLTEDEDEEEEVAQDSAEKELEEAIRLLEDEAADLGDNDESPEDETTHEEELADQLTEAFKYQMRKGKISISEAIRFLA